MDAVAPLAGQIVQVLAPFLPYLIKMGEGLGASVGHEVENRGLDVAAKLWSRIGPQLEAAPSAKEAAADVAAEPSDEDARAALRVQIRKLLADEPGLQQDIEAVLKEAHASGQTITVTASGERSVAIGHDAQGSTITTGDQLRP